MNARQDNPSNDMKARPSRGQRFIAWIQEPFGSVMLASAASIGSLGIVLSSMWAIQATLN